MDTNQDAKTNVLSAGGIALIAFCVTHALATWLHKSDGTFFTPSSRHVIYLVAQLSSLSLGFALIFFFIGYSIICVVNLLCGRLLERAAFKPSNIYEAIVASFLIGVFVVFTGVVVSRTVGVNWHLNYSWTLTLSLIFGAALSWYGMGTINRAFLFPPTDLNQRLVLIGSILVIIIMVLLLYDYLSANQFSDDEQEATQFAISLGSHAFPYWDLENGSWGFYHSFMLFAYPMYALTVLFGDGERTFRMLYFVSLFICLIGLMGLFELLTKKSIRAFEFITFLLGVILITIVSAYYNSWHPYIAGLAEPSAVDMFGFSLFLGSAIFLFTDRNRIFLCFSIAGFAALPSGFIYTVTLLGLTAFFEISDRRRAAILLLEYLGAIGLYYVLYSCIYHVQNHWSVTEFGEHYFSRAADVASSIVFLRLICLVSGGTIIPTCVVLLKGKNAYAKVLSAFACLHVSAGLIFKDLQHIHYYLPVCLLLYIVGLYGLRLFGTRIRTVGISSIQFVIISVTWFIFPSMATPLDNAKRLGAATALDCSTKNLETLYRDGSEFTKYISWGEQGISLHNWIYYSLVVKPKVSRDIIIADVTTPIPKGYRLLSAGAKCQVIANEAFDPTNYLPCYSYRQERGWSLLTVPIWREHFSGRAPPIRNCDSKR